MPEVSDPFYMNQPPQSTNLEGDVATYQFGGPVRLDVGGDASITDTGDFEGGSLTVAVTTGEVPSQDLLGIALSASVDVSGSTVWVEGFAIGTVTGGSSGADLVISFNANATAARVQTLVRALEYSNSDRIAPDLSLRGITLTLVDGDGGGTDTLVVNTSVQLLPNAAPVSGQLEGDSATFIVGMSGARVDVGGDATITDTEGARFGGGSLTVSITGGEVPGEDVLGIALVTNVTDVVGSTVWVEGFAIGTVTGGANGNDLVISFNSNATPTRVQTLVRAIEYSNSAGGAAQHGTREITLALIDGDGNNGGLGNDRFTVETSVEVVPPLSLGNQIFFDANGNGTFDPSGNPGSDTGIDGVSLTLFADSNLNGVFDAGDAVVATTVTSGGGTYQFGMLAAGDYIVRVDASNFTGSGALVGMATTRGSTDPDDNIGNDDNGYAGEGYVASLPITLAVDSEPTAGPGNNTNNRLDLGFITANRAPTSTNLALDVAVFTEGGAAAKIDVGGNAVIADVDSANFGGGSLAVVITAGAVASEDVLGFDVNGAVAATESLVSVGGVTIGTWAGGSNGNALIFSFNSDATAARVQTLVRALQYTNSNTVAPDENQRTITLYLADGDGNNEGFGSDTLVVNTAIDIAPINDVPAATNLAGDSVSFIEDGAPVKLDAGGNAVITDGDSENFGGGELTVAITSGLSAGEDVLGFDTSGDVSLAGDVVSVGSVQIGTVAGGTAGNPLIFSFNSNATSALVQTLVRSLNYSNTDTATPNTASRGITITLVDGEGNSGGLGSDTVTVETSVSVVPVNDTPVVTTTSPAAANEQSAIYLDPSISISDADLDSKVAGGDYLGATLSVGRSGGASAEDLLEVVNGAGFTISGSQLLAGGLEFGTVTGGNGTGLLIQFTSGETTASTALVDAVARAIRYTNLSDAPPASVDIAFIFGDDSPAGGQGSNVTNGATAVGTVTVNVTGTNDAVVSGVPGAQNGFEDSDLVFTGAAAITVSDPDGGNVTVTLAVEQGTLSLSGVAGLSFSAGDGTGDAAMTFSGSIADVNAALTGLVYRGTASYSGTDTLTVTTTDGVATTVETIAIALANDDVWVGTPNPDTFTAMSDDDWTISGLADSDTLGGAGGDDWIDGGAGADTLTGGAGDDTYVVDDAADAVIEAADGGHDLVRSSASYTLADHVEDLRLTGSAAINGTGNGLNNMIWGNGGANRLDGGAGADVMAGGNGNDTYVIDTPSDQVVEAAPGGTDTVEAGFSYTLGENIENLTLTGSGNIDGNGNGLDNFLTGNGGDNVLNGGAGGDKMAGGGGHDTYIVDSGADRTFEQAGGGTDTVLSSVSHTLLDHLESLTLTGSAGINGTGNALANVLVGNNGANRLDGRGGADSMVGGLGNDTYVIDDLDDQMGENANGGTDTVEVGRSFTLAVNFERLVLTGTGNFTGTGNAANNYISGNSGKNVLDGAGGGDKMFGFLGDDTYIVDSGNDRAYEFANSGTDLVLSAVSYALDSHVENLTLTGALHMDAVGNALANILIGNSGNNLLDGKAGTDSMSGGLGDDTYVIDNLGDQVAEAGAAGGTDTVRSAISYTLGEGLEKLQLTGSAVNGTGNAAANELRGNGAANLLDGGAGADTMHGNRGNDTYVVDNTGDTAIEEDATAGIDTVLASVSFQLGTNVENLTLSGSANLNGGGNALANLLTGNAGANLLRGGGGNDQVNGGHGNDQINGGLGNDLLLGGAGLDVFQFNSALGAGNVDSLVDFVASDDSIHLSRSRFTAAGASGTLAASAFHTGSAAADASDRIVYDSVTGNIFYDADGSGAAAAVLFASVTAGTALTNLDFVLYTG